MGAVEEAVAAMEVDSAVAGSEADWEAAARAAEARAEAGMVASGRRLLEEAGLGEAVAAADW